MAGLFMCPSSISGGSSTGCDGALRYACAVPLVFLTTGLLGASLRCPRNPNNLHEIMRYYENYLSYVSYVLRWDELVDEMGRILNLRMIADDCSDIESAWKRLTRTDPRFVLSFAHELIYAGGVWLVVVLLHISGKPLDAKGAAACGSSNSPSRQDLYHPW